MILCDTYHITRVIIDNVRMSTNTVRMHIKTRPKTEKTKEYKTVKMDIKSGGNMGKINRRMDKNQTVSETKNNTQKD